MYPFLFFCSFLGSCSLGMAMSVLNFLYLARLYPWNIGNVWFTFSFCVIALCLMCVYIYMPACVWVIVHFVWWTLELHERPSLVMRAFDLVVWVCAQGDCHRCIFMLYCVHNHRDVIALIHVTKWHWCHLANYHLFSVRPWSTVSLLRGLRWTWRVSPQFGPTLTGSILMIYVRNILLPAVRMLLRILFLTPCVVIDYVESLGRCWSYGKPELRGSYYCCL